MQSILWAATGTGFTFLMTTLGAAMVFLFRKQLNASIQRIFLANGALYDLGLSKPNFIVLVISLLLLLLADVCKYRGVKVRNVILNLNIIIRWTIIIVGILGILIFGIWGSGYSETNFIYFQF